MKYEIENWNNRIIFVFKDTPITFEAFSALIDIVLQPDKKTETEITSFTQSFTFFKDGIEIYFEHFYDNDSPLYTFELFPIKTYNAADFIKLKNMMDKLNTI